MRTLSTAALVLAITLTFTACGKGGGDVKLLESITDDGGKVLQKFEYDDKNRIVKIIEGTTTKTITYNSDDLVTVERIEGDNDKSVTKYAKNGSAITREDKNGKDTLTIDKYGYAVKNDANVKYEYKDGNLISEKFPNKDACESCEDISTYTYDNKKSPYSNVNAPKWLLQMLLGVDYASKNNPLSSFFDNGNEGGGSNYEYEYDSEGFPIICTITFSGEGADDSPKTIIHYTYRTGCK